MLKAISYKTNQFLLALIKLSLVVGAFYFIYDKLFFNADLNFREFIHNLSNFGAFTPLTLLFLVVLSYFNWFFEILKWKTLVQGISKISLKEARSQTLGALTASLLTPNRIGEYGAKALYFQPHQRKKVMFHNLIGNSAQMLVTTVFGAIGMMYLSGQFGLLFHIEKTIIALFSVFFLTSGFIILLKTKWFRSIKNQFLKIYKVALNIPKNILLLCMLFSIVRYLIFSFQFYYLLTLFGASINYITAMSTIATLYLLTSMIPSIFIFDLIIKGGVAVYLFSFMVISEPIILTIVMLMWILNFVLPSIIGSYHVLLFKLPKPVV